MLALKQGSVPDVIANKLDHLLILTSGTEQYLITCTNKKYKFLLTTTLTISGVYKHIILNIYQKVNQNFLTSNSNGVIIVSDRVIKHARVNHTLE